MAVVNRCDYCGVIYDGAICPTEGCKEKAEKDFSEKMNKEAVERIKKDTLSKEEADRLESLYFEDDVEITIRDGNAYRIPPASLRDARSLMKKLKTVNVDVIVFNFIPTGDEALDNQREQDLYDIMLMAFKNYKHVDRDYIDEHVDVESAKKIIEILIGINGIKK